MAEYALYRMRLRQENLLAPISSKMAKGQTLSDYRQSLRLNWHDVERTLMRNESDKLSPAMQQYYWARVKDFCQTAKKRRKQSRTH